MHYTKHVAETLFLQHFFVFEAHVNNTSNRSSMLYYKCSVKQIYALKTNFKHAFRMGMYTEYYVFNTLYTV